MVHITSTVGALSMFVKCLALTWCLSHCPLLLSNLRYKEVVLSAIIILDSLSGPLPHTPPVSYRKGYHFLVVCAAS